MNKYAKQHHKGFLEFQLKERHRELKELEYYAKKMQSLERLQEYANTLDAIEFKKREIKGIERKLDNS